MSCIRLHSAPPINSISRRFLNIWMASMTKHFIVILLTALAVFYPVELFADECVIEQVKNAESSRTVAEIRERCAQNEIEAELEKTSPDSTSFKTGLISKRVLRESKSAVRCLRHHSPPHQLFSTRPIK